MNLSKALLLAATCVYGAEGFAGEAYLDTLPHIPIWTIGHGTTRVNGSSVYPGMTCTRGQADDWAMADMTSSARWVLSQVSKPLDDYQLAALTSFCYNIGIGAFAHSSVCAALNLGLYQVAANRLLEYDESGGHFVAGLSTRRWRERALFLSHMGPLPPVALFPATTAPSEADALNDAELSHIKDTP